LRKSPLFSWLTFLVILVANYLVFIWVPLEKVMREVQKIFYFHVAAYSIIWLLIFLYTLSINKRQKRLGQEVESLQLVLKKMSK